MVISKSFTTKKFEHFVSMVPFLLTDVYFSLLQKIFPTAQRWQAFFNEATVFIDLLVTMKALLVDAFGC